MPVLSEDRLHRLIADILVEGGLTAGEANACADAALFADLRGTATHGIVYMIPNTLDSIRQGKTVSGRRPEAVRATGASVLLKGKGVPGPVLAREAMQTAMARARENGIGVVNAFNGNPIGLLGYYAHLAAEAGLIGIVMANTAPAAAPHGSVGAVFGTNPFAYAAPSTTSRPIIFDVATTVASAGKIGQHRRRGTPIPAGWLIDAAGEPVTDPQRAGEGVMLPCGGHKGSGFGLLIHLLTGGLSETTIGGDQTHNHADPERRGQGALFLALDPDLFGSRAGFATMVERQIGMLHAAPGMPGQGVPRYPGERGWAEFDHRRSNGIPIPAEDWETVAAAVRSAGIMNGHLPEDVVAGTAP